MSQLNIEAFLQTQTTLGVLSEDIFTKISPVTIKKNYFS